MSIKYINWAFETDCPSSSAKLVLIKLADNANDTGECWPSMDYISRHTQLHRATVIRSIKKLEEAGLIETIRQKVGDVSLPNHYHLRGVVAQCDQGSRTVQLGGSRTVLPKPSPSEPSLNQEVKSSVPDDPALLKDDIEKCVYNWDVTTAEPLGLSRVEVLNKSRRQKLKDRLEEVGKEGWDRALEQLERSAFCQGKNDRGWKASFDFMCQPDSLAKLIEGGYGGE